MEAIHKLKVYCPYDIVKIENIKISCKPNEHGYLYLKCLIDDSIKFKYSIEASTEDKIMLYEELEGKEKSIIFTGIIENVRTTNENGIYYLELEAASSSSILDKEEKTRSFQDAEMSYDDLINEVLKSYKDISLGFTQRMDRPMSIGKPLFQYKETDYEFLKRVASLLGLDLVCDIIKYENAFYFGRPLGEKYKLEDDISYKACKDLERYHKAVTRGFDVDFHDTDFFYYEIENHTKMDIGDQIYFKQKDLYVNQFEAELHKGELIYKYRFCRESGIWQDKLYNEKIRGRSLEGEVLETDGEKLKLHLYIDESQEPSKAAWFYYAPPSGNILYSMPIVGESATLYFQDEVDSDPIVTGCARKNGSTCEQMSDTADRYFATETGDYLDILPGAINLHRDGLNVNFTDGGGITFSSSGNLSISGGSVSLSGGSVSINATSQIKVQKGKSSYISAENEFYTQANTVYENGSARDSYAAFIDDEPTAGVAVALAKQMQALAKQNQESLKFNNGNLMSAMSGSKTTFGVPATFDEFLEQRANMCKIDNSEEAQIVNNDGKSIPLNQLQDWQIDALKLHEDLPVKDKIGTVFKFLYDRWIKYPSDTFGQIALNSGVQPQYAKIAGDFTTGMALESVATISITGLKSAIGGFSYDEDAIAGIGIGNIAKGENNSREIILDTEKSYNSARNTLINELDNTSAFTNGSKAYIGRLESSYGYNKQIGRQSLDGKVRWRLDYDSELGVHYNIENFTTGKGINSVKKVIPIDISYDEYKAIIDSWNNYV